MDSIHAADSPTLNAQLATVCTGFNNQGLGVFLDAHDPTTDTTNGSNLIANLGLNAILAYSTPVLMFLYPLSIVLILLTLGGGLFGNDRGVLRWTIGFTMAAAIIDLLRTLPETTRTLLHLEPLVNAAENWLPLCKLGFGWVCPAILGLVIGLALRRVRRTA